MSQDRPQKDYRSALRGVLDDVQRGSGGGKFWKPRKVTSKNDDGDCIRLIAPPYMPPDPEFGIVLAPWVAFRQYKLQGIEGLKWGKSVTVPSDYGLPDPIEPVLRELDEGSKSDRKLAREMFPRQKFIALIVDLENAPDKVVPWEFGKTVAEQILKFATTKGYNLPWDIDEGHDLFVRATGEGWETKYEITPDPRPSALPNADALLEQAGKIDLAKFVIVETEETLEELLDGKYDKEEAKERRIARDKLHGRPFPFFLNSSGRDDDEDEDAPAQSTRKRAAAGKEETAATPPPARNRRKPAPKDTEETVDETPQEAAPEDAPPADEPPAQKPARRRAAAEPPPAQRKLKLDDDVTVTLEGETVVAKIIEMTNNGQAVVLVEGDGPLAGEWDVAQSECTLVAEPAASDTAKPTRRRSAAPAAAEDTAPVEAPKSSIVDRVAQIQAKARGNGS